MKVIILLAVAAIAAAQKTPFELNEILTGVFRNRGWNATWISGDTLLYANEVDEGIYSYNVKTDVISIFFGAEVMANYSGASFTHRPDQQYILIKYNENAVFRHSTTAQFAIYSISTQAYFDVAGARPLQLATWNPVGGLTYVLDNDIYYLVNPEDVGNPIRLTNDGVVGVVYNGVPDWVYEEEVLGTGSAIWSSPDGRYLAYAQFNDSNVEQFSYSLYGNPGDLKDQYPRIVTVRYPKVGTTNPTVSLRIINLQGITNNTVVIDTLLALDEEAILFDMVWATTEQVSVVVMNRVQNAANVTRCDVISKSCNVESSFGQVNGWLDLNAPLYSADGTKALFRLSQPEGADSFIHIVLFDFINVQATRLTNGMRVVTGINGWDEANNLIYYSGSVVDNPSQQQVYSVNVVTGEDKCLTCNFQTPEGPCRYASASFSSDFSYYTKICRGLGPGYIEIQNSSSVSDSLVWEDNALIRSQLANKLMPVIKDLKLISPDGFPFRARLLLPPDLNETSPEKYPMVVNVYAGPDSNQILDSFGVGFDKYIVTNRKYIYAFIDGRGSGRQGNNLIFSVFRQMGNLEIDDQLTVTQFLKESFPYIDANNTGIWGWSYGGFSTAWAMAKDTTNIFKFGLSVAPVTSFIYYDSIYTERYMGLPTPEDNLGGYNNTDVTRQAAKFKGKQYLLIHGNGDDNVHYQQSMLLSKALEQADVLFQQQSYPDEQHSLRHVSPHLYHTIDRFWARSFGLPDPQIIPLPEP